MAEPMDSRTRVLTAMRRRAPDRVPHEVGVWLTPEVYADFRQRTGQTDAAAYFGADVRPVGIAATHHPNDYAPYHPDLPDRAWLDEWGIGHLPTVSTEPGHAHLEGFLYPMARLSAREVRDYPLPDVAADYRYEHLPGEVARIQGQGLAAMGCMECTVFEIAWYMRSMEQLMMGMVDDPETAENLLDRITDLRVVQARRFAEAGVDIIRFGDDIASQRGMLMSLPMWRRWLKPRLARAIAAARHARPDVLVFYHSDGDVRAAVPDLIEIGVDILNPVQSECVDPAEMKRLYGDRLSFWGSVGTQTTLPFGTPQDVRAEVKHRMATAGVGGGLLLGPTHMIEPDVPWENIVALVDAIREHGAYPNGCVR
jgi:uroporphyrinogen decarboxylase